MSRDFRHFGLLSLQPWQGPRIYQFNANHLAPPEPVDLLLSVLRIQPRAKEQHRLKRRGRITGSGSPYSLREQDTIAWVMPHENFSRRHHYKVNLPHSLRLSELLPTSISYMSWQPWPRTIGTGLKSGVTRRVWSKPNETSLRPQTTIRTNVDWSTNVLVQQTYNRLQTSLLLKRPRNQENSL